jgi:anti-sigma factor ChrR (cupin superfamily)
MQGRRVERMPKASREETQTKKQDGWDIEPSCLFSSVFSREAGRFTAGQLDAPAHSRLTPPTEECNCLRASHQ